MALFPNRRGDVPDVMAVKQSLEDVKGYVPQLPRKPRAVTVDEEMVKDLLGGDYAIKKKLIQEPKAAVLRMQLTQLEAFFGDEVNLERDSNAVKAITLRDINQFARRFLGFAQAFHVPLDLRYVANGQLIAQFIAFLFLRKKTKGENSENKSHSYASRVLSVIVKLLTFVGSIEPQKKTGIEALIKDVRNFASQLLASGDKRSTWSLEDLVDDGKCVSYEDLVATVHEANSAFLPTVTQSIANARKMQSALLSQLLTQMPAQRSAVYTALQIVNDRRHVMRPESNYIHFSESSGCWKLVINEHKNDGKVAIEPMLIPQDSLLDQILWHWTEWAEELLLVEEFDGGADAEGCAFFTANGKRYTAENFYLKIKSTIKEAMGNPNLQIGIKVLRRLVASSDMYATEDPSLRSTIAEIAGHSLLTEHRAYSARPTTKQSSAALEFAYDKQLSLIKRRREEGGEEEEDAKEKKRYKATPEKPNGRPTQMFPFKDLLEVEEVEAMTIQERKVAFHDIYGRDTSSGNQNWLKHKLTGQPINVFEGRKATKSAEASEEEWQ